jgi:hypothetical protein
MATGPMGHIDIVLGDVSQARYLVSRLSLLTLHMRAHELPRDAEYTRGEIT